MSNFRDLSYEEAFKKLKEEGLEPNKLGAVLQIRDVFAKWGRETNPAIKQDKHGWRVEDVSYVFSSEKEAEIFFFVEKTLLPNERDISLKIRRMALICHISGIETNYTF